MLIGAPVVWQGLELRNMDREIELKFLIAPEAAEDILSLLDGESDIRQLTATYFDTADHALRRAGFGLRVRDGEGGRKQTLKSASAGGIFSRGEWETSIAGPGPDSAALSTTPAAGVVRDQALSPVFTTQVERKVRMIRRGETLIEAVVDRGELIGQTRRAQICELELELKAGAPVALFDLARELAERASLRLSLVSKAERGYDLALEDRLATTLSRSQAILSPDFTTAQALQAVGRAALSQLCGNAEALRERPSPEGVHQLRVAARRMRALLKAFRPLSAGPDAKAIDAELKWLSGELDLARELDVFIADVWHPASHCLQTKGATALGRALLAAQAKAYLRMEAALFSPRTRALMLETAAWLETGAWTSAPDLASDRDHVATDFASALLDHLRTGLVKKSEHLDRMNAEARHRLRLKGKVLRYAAADLSTLFPDHPKRTHRFIEAAKALQDGLGRLNDLHVRSGLVEGIALASGDTEAQLAAANLTDGADEAALLRDACKARKAFVQAKPFW